MSGVSWICRGDVLVTNHLHTCTVCGTEVCYQRLSDRRRRGCWAGWAHMAHAETPIEAVKRGLVLPTGPVTITSGPRQRGKSR